MSNPEIKVDVILDDAGFQNKAGNVRNQIDQTAKQFKSLGREISEVSRTMIFFGGAVTAGVGAAFNKAAKDIPALGNQLNQVSNAFQVLANNVAIAATPSLTAFTDILNGVVNAVSKFVIRHQVMVNQFIKYSAIAVVVGTLGIAIGKLLQTMQAIIKLGVAFAGIFTLASLQIILITAAVVALVVALAFLSDKFLGTNFADDFNRAIGKMKSTVDKFMSDFQEGTEKGVVRATQLWGKFAEGFKSNFESMADSMKTLGASIGAAMETGLSTAIFDVFKGKVESLKSVLISFSDDVLKAFSRMLANKALAALFGDKDGGKGIFSALGSMLGFGGDGKSKVAEENTLLVKDNSMQFRDLTANMKLFGRVKDEVIDKFRKFNRIELTKGKGAPPVLPGGAGFGAGGDTALSGLGSSIEDALEPIATLNESLAVTTAFTATIGSGFTAISGQIKLMGATYVATQGLMVIASAIAATLTVGIVAFAASAIAALWAPAAILASIATLGGAAAIGVSAVSAAVGSAPGISKMGGVSGGGGSDPSITFADIPKMADGGIVSKPTIALIGEAGPEAVVPLSKKGMFGGGGGGTTVHIQINEAILNSPSNMKDFVRVLKEELAR